MDHIDISHLEYEEGLSLLKDKLLKKEFIRIKIDFGVDHSQSKIIRDFVGYLFDINDVVGPWKGRFILITDELINNAIEHGSKAGDLDSCYIYTKKGPDGGFNIALEVHDTGRGKDSKKIKKMEEIRTLNLKQENSVYMEKRGRGLFRITEKLVDRLEFAESPKGGLAVKIEKNIPQSD